MRPFDQIGTNEAPAPPPSPAPPPPPRRRIAGPLVAIAFAGSTLFAGAIGAVGGAQLVRAQLEQSAPPAATGSPQPSGTANTSGGTIASAVYDKVSSSVVQLLVGGTGRSRGTGSGVIIDPSGFILTNNHVVAGARTITVKFSDGQTRTAQVVGTDRGNDLALLKVDLPAGATAATLGDSEQVKVGETAIAIGSPFGLEQTVTQGIISAVNRSWQPSSGPLQTGLIQTDAPINPGNSGGPLLNAQGQVIGINTLIESPVEGSVGIGFAVPINTAKQLLPRLQAGANLQPGWLGIAAVSIDTGIASAQGLSVTSGVLITSVVTDSPAARAGLRGGTDTGTDVPSGGDVITAVDGQAVASMADLAARLSKLQPGTNVRLSVLRAGQRLEITATLQAWPAQSS